MKRSYHTITTKGPTSARRLAEFFSRNGQGLLPMVDLIEQSQLAKAGRLTKDAAQVTQLHKLKKIVGEPYLPRRQRSSPECAKWLLTVA